MRNRGEEAYSYFLEGYNCSQAVVMAYRDFFPSHALSSILSLSSPFGGGMGRLREVCGTVSGMFLVAGVLYGYDKPDAQLEKTEHYKRIQELASHFREENGSIICRELLGLKQGWDEPVPELRTAEYYKKRPCSKLAGMSARIMDSYIKEQEEKNKNS